MPFSRPSLSTLISQAAADIASAIPGADALLRFSNLSIFGRMFAGLAHLHYGYQDWISKQAVPFTAEDEFLEGWAAFKNVIRKPAAKAGAIAPGQVTFTNCVPAKSITANTPLVRGDGANFTVIAGALVDGSGNITVSVAAVDPGASGNCDVGIVLTLAVSIAGIQSSGTVTTEIAGGTDTESNTDFRNRMLSAFQNPPQGGAAGDYINWSLSVPGVTRAWCRPNGNGAGTVIVYFMMDETEAAFGGFPQGTNGVATLETRAAAATGDQLIVANVLFPLAPVTALVFAFAPSNNAVNFTIAGLSGASPDLKAAVEAAIDDVFTRKGSPGGVFLADGSAGGTIALSDIESGIASVSGTEGFVITSPTTNITSSTGALPTRGTVTYS